jgi:glucan 1,3-beta-glucosidase
VSPYTPGAWPYLLQALNWARANNIHVILDIHGAPGSQNGYDNSGQRTNNPVWGVTQSDLQRTIDTLTFIAKEIGGMLDVLELINEAAGFEGQNWLDNIRQFYQDGYNAVRDVAGQDLVVMIGDAFSPVDVRCPWLI